MISFTLNGQEVSVEDDNLSLLDALREELGCRSVKDGCSPQGQCGCCTVWIDGAPRVSCVTALRRVRGRFVTTVEGLDPDLRERWSEALCAKGASQCGYCTPGILMRLASLEFRKSHVDEPSIRSALGAHLCRCTGWQTIVEAANSLLCIEGESLDLGAGDLGAGDLGASIENSDLMKAWRAQLEGPTFQSSSPKVVLGDGGFADDTSPPGTPIAMFDQVGSFSIYPSISASRRGSSKVQGRNSTIPLRCPLQTPQGEWDIVLSTTWVEPSYLEPDASWCDPKGVPASPLANGGAFGGKRLSPVPEQARFAAFRTGSRVKVLWSREDVVRYGPKRPPISIGINVDGRGIVRVGCTPNSTGSNEVVRRIQAIFPDVVVEKVTIPGPPTSSDIRGAGWAEAMAVSEAIRAMKEGRVPRGDDFRTATAELIDPGGGRARVTLHVPASEAAEGPPSLAGSPSTTISVEVWAGELLDPVTLRSYCIGAVHQALGLVWSEGIAVDDSGEIHDLTMRSFGILSAQAMPHVEVTLHASDLWPMPGSNAVYAATLAAAWIADGLPPMWPTRRSVRSVQTGSSSHDGRTQ